MSAVNPYAAPKAAVADVDEYDVATQPVRTWSGKGRVGRLRYFAHIMGAYLLAIAFALFVGFAFGFIGAQKLTPVVTGIGVFAYFWFLILKTIQRSHDMDWSGWTAILALIPFVGLLWLFKGGTPGGNRFGGPAPANTAGVRILGFLLPVIMIVGILAAVAIPAYSDYAKRAKAVRMK